MSNNIDLKSIVFESTDVKFNLNNDTCCIININKACKLSKQILLYKEKIDKEKKHKSIQLHIKECIYEISHLEIPIHCISKNKNKDKTRINLHVSIPKVKEYVKYNNCIEKIGSVAFKEKFIKKLKERLPQKVFYRVKELDCDFYYSMSIQVNA